MIYQRQRIVFIVSHLLKKTNSTTLSFSVSGNFDGGESFKQKSVTKWEMRKRLVFICNFAINARPSRGNLRQVFGFLTSEEIALTD